MGNPNAIPPAAHEASRHAAIAVLQFQKGMMTPGELRLLLLDAAARLAPFDDNDEVLILGADGFRSLAADNG